MDNASIHTSAEVRQLCKECGVQLEYLPPYSPHFNPIEQTFNVLKAWIQRHFWRVEFFEDFGRFLELALREAIDASNVECHYEGSGYSRIE